MLKLHNKQAGISHPNIILGLLVYIFVLIIGWQIIINSNFKLSSLLNFVNIFDNSEVPKDFVEYKNTDLGFGFDYPKEWGDVKLETIDLAQQNNDDSMKGRYVKVGFSNNKNVVAAMKSKDLMWPGGHADCDGMVSLGFEEFAPEEPGFNKINGKPEKIEFNKLTETDDGYGNKTLITFYEHNKSQQIYEKYVLSQDGTVYDCLPMSIESLTYFDLGHKFYGMDVLYQMEKSDASFYTKYFAQDEQYNPKPSKFYEDQYNNYKKDKNSLISKIEREKLNKFFDSVRGF